MTIRTFRPLNQDKILTQSFTIDEMLPPDHPARRLVALLASWDLTALYQQYAIYGPPAYDPRQLLAVVLYGYMNGLFSSRQLERATYESIPCIYLMGGAHPDHSTFADFRTLLFRDESALFAQVLRAAQHRGLLTLEAVSGDGTKIHADASKHTAVSYDHAVKSLAALRQQVSELRALALREPSALPPEMDLAAELQLRLDRIDRLEEAIQVIEERAALRDQQDQAAYEAKLAARAERERMTGKKARGKAPEPPTPGPRPDDQYNLTDAESRIMKNSTNKGVDQHYNAQLAVEHQHRLIVGCAVSDQPNDMQQAIPVLQSIPPELGLPTAAAFDAGYRSEQNILALEQMGILPYVATGKREAHGLNWRKWYATHPDTPPPADADALARMEYTLTTPEGQAIYRQRKSTVEPVIGIIKETLGFRQFSVRGLDKVRGEWRLVCTAYNVKRLLTLLVPPQVKQAVNKAKSGIIVAISSALVALCQLAQRGNNLYQRHMGNFMSRCETQAVLAGN